MHPTNDNAVETCEWDTDDELQMEFFQETDNHQATALSSSSSSQNPAVLHRFVAMGFNEKLVIRALNKNGEEDTEAILNTLLSYSVVENFPSEDPYPSRASLPYEELSDCSSNCVEEEEDITKDTLSRLIGMGYEYVDAVKAIDHCGSDAPLDELTDFIFAAQTAETDTNAPTLTPQKRRPSFGSIERPCKLVQSVRIRDSVNLPNNMIGFGVPGCSRVSKRDIPKLALGPPYFYYENVACTPKGVWEEISRFLYDITPEFVDSLHFSAAARKRGYIHNLPIENRQPLLPIPPKTIHEALPFTKKWWPTWDRREKLNCLLTCIGSAPLTERIRKRVESGTPSPSDIDYVMKQCKKWNLVWVGKYKVAVLEPNDMEMLLGFPQDHTRGVSWTDRYKALGNSFQIDTIAYHLSVLKPIYPRGMTILSLFSGIGGAEVALHRLGIPLKAVVSIEISEVNRKIFQDWWDQTEQPGKLIHVDDVQKVDYPMIRRWITEFDGFDLVIGGSPCNNLAGGNRRTRDGLQGQHSSLFFQYYRILDTVTSLMKKRYLIVRNVAALGCGEELKNLFATYGQVEECKPMDAEECEAFTDVYWIKFCHISNARFAKRKLDESVFLGNRLQVSYAPEYESVSDTQEKLDGRIKEVCRRLEPGKSKSGDMRYEGARGHCLTHGAVPQVPQELALTQKRSAIKMDHLSQVDCPPMTHVSSDQDYFQSQSMNETVRMVRAKLDKAREDGLCAVLCHASEMEMAAQAQPMACRAWACLSNFSSLTLFLGILSVSGGPKACHAGVSCVVPRLGKGLLSQTLAHSP
ncbi:hypothetical protein KSS87_003316 [Heliosperma pusillum]|nr:hypothetical protein KSS87_003316 [Heliosperma pusillum]